MTLESRAEIPTRQGASFEPETSFHSSCSVGGVWWTVIKDPDDDTVHGTLVTMSLKIQLTTRCMELLLPCH
ncbi:hypothetical protein RRG08_045904 [Elysia crispata]|uniref:Uncharacterized protein n=1 Tax=Elysia crispata TaxID=231223 RepID=A0AAE1E3N6_9GAST|nr:hypothetical protein RRG08_045904 [Elysia crispata]